jgi:hypothetical protein
LTGARTFLGHVEQAPGCINVLDVGEGWVVRTINLRLWDPLSLDGRAGVPSVDREARRMRPPRHSAAPP